MIPAFSTVEDIKLGMKMQNSPILPPFSPRSKLRSSQTRGFSPMKQSRTVDRFPPLRNPSSPNVEELYSATVVPAQKASDQYKSFQSTTILRSVPIMRRHLDNFGGRTFSLPAKTKPVPFHTGRFIYDPSHRPVLVDELSQNQRLQAEMAMVEKVRGLKRKREAIGHRWGWRKFRLNGMEVSRNERFNLQAEVQKLKELILPPTARDIYTGRGIRLPDGHHTRRAVRVRSPPEIPPFAPPPSAWVGPEPHKPHTTTAALPHPYDAPPKPGTVWSNRGDPQVNLRNTAPPAQRTLDLVVQSVPVPGIPQSPATHPGENVIPENEALPEDEGFPEPEPSHVMQLNEPVEQIEVVEPRDTILEEQVASTVPASPSVIPETPVDRSRSMAAPSASPDGRAHNPLISTSALDDAVASEEECSNLREKFFEIKSEETGSASFEQVSAHFPSELSQRQVSYLQTFYDLASQNQSFGPEEFIALTSLAQKVNDFSPSIREMFEQINFQTLEESIAQYTELFGSVDRTARGRIGVGALLQILSTTLQRQLEPDTRLAAQIMETTSKEITGDVTRLEFLSFIPYFLYLEEMG